MQDTEKAVSLREQLVAMRLAKKLRQVDVAESMGVGQPSVSEFERGETNPRLDTLQRYARAIGARIEFEVVDDGNE